MNKSDVLISELSALQQKAKDLVVERKQLQDRLKVVDEEIYALNSRHGRIERLEKEIQSAVQFEKDEFFPRPTWIHKPSGSDEKTFVISRITPKRIYIRQQGRVNETFYCRENGRTSYSFDGALDVSKTIFSWEENQKCNT